MFCVLGFVFVSEKDGLNKISTKKPSKKKKSPGNFVSKIIQEKGDVLEAHLRQAQLKQKQNKQNSSAPMPTLEERQVPMPRQMSMDRGASTTSTGGHYIFDDPNGSSDSDYDSDDEPRSFPLRNRRFESDPKDGITNAVSHVVHSTYLQNMHAYICFSFH